MATSPTEHRAKIAEARNVLGEVIARARFAGEPTVLINRGKEAAVIVGYDFYEQAKRDRAALQALEQIAEAQDVDPGFKEGHDYLRKALALAKQAPH